MHRPLRDYLKGGDLAGGSHHFDVGQPVSYADDVLVSELEGGFRQGLKGTYEISFQRSRIRADGWGKCAP